MCGISGGISKKFSEDIIKKITSTLKHRGPDDSGIFLDGKNNIFLGHRRLAIIDLSERAKQPFEIQNERSKFKSYVITYNGEVYNYKEIKKELEEKGYKFRSNSDTEVVLNSYIEWGINCVNKFRGMFAFAIWDSQKEKLYLFRDRFGVKPLYYYFDGENFLFSSELKALYQFPEFKKEIDFTALSFYFQLGYIPAPYTIFKNTFKLEKGCVLEVDKNFNLNKFRYWEAKLYFLKEKIKKPEKEIIVELEHLLRESFQYRMIADVEVGIFLSGGIDSSLLTAVLQRSSLKKIKTFTIGFKEKSYDEAPIAKKVSQILGTDHYEYYLSAKDLENVFSEYIEIFDEPFGDSSALPTYLLAKFAREKVKVVLSGDGGDELFLGYDKYRAIEIIKNLPPFLRIASHQFLKKLGPERTADFYLMISKIFPLPKIFNLREKLSKLINSLGRKNLCEIFQFSNTYWLKEELKDLFRKEVFNDNLKQFYYEDNIDFREQMQLWDINYYLADDILVKTDRTTMAVGLECREPYLDQKIFEYLSRLSPDCKFRKGKPKYLLKKILYQYLPASLFKRPKTGFRVPIYEWLKKEWKSYLKTYLDISYLKNQGIFDEEFIKKILDQYEGGKYINPDKLWLLLNFQLWAQKWLK